MTTPRHDGEVGISAATVRALLQEELPELARLPLQQVTGTGSDNALYRLGGELVVRLPRLTDAARRLGVELDWLPRLSHLSAGVPEVVHAGRPGASYPFRWGGAALAGRPGRVGGPPPARVARPR